MVKLKKLEFGDYESDDGRFRLARDSGHWHLVDTAWEPPRGTRHDTYRQAVAHIKETLARPEEGRPGRPPLLHNEWTRSGRQLPHVPRTTCDGPVGLQPSTLVPDRAEAICTRCGHHLGFIRTGPSGHWWLTFDCPPDPSAAVGPPKSPKKARRQIRLAQQQSEPGPVAPEATGPQSESGSQPE